MLGIIILSLTEASVVPVMGNLLWMNTILLRYTMRSALEADDTLNKKSKSIQVHSFNNATDENILLQLIVKGS